jgi:biopolymer transport protein ExbD
MIAAWNDLALSWIRICGAAVAQNTIFLALVLLVLRALHDAPARYRHAITQIGLVKLLLPPLVVWPWSSGGPLFGATGGESGFGPLIFGAAAPALAAGGAAEKPGMPALLLLAWATGALLLLGLPSLGTWRLSRRLQDARPLPPGELPCDLPPGVAVHRSPSIAMPLTLGPWPRRIYVPAEWDGWSQDCRRLAILHELEHLDRRDGLWQGLQLMARALYFFHPLVWLLDRQLDTTREMAVDDVAAGTDRQAGAVYSRLLVAMADSLAGGREPSGTAAALFRRRRDLMNRIRYQLRKGEIMKARTGRAYLAAGILVALAGLLCWRPQTGGTDPAAAALPAAIQPSTDAGLSAGTEKPAAPAKKRRDLTIGILGDDQVTLQKHPLSIADLGRKLTGKDWSQEKVVFTLTCADGVTMGDVHTVSTVLRKVVEMPKVRFVSAKGEAVPMVLPSAGIQEKLAQVDPADRFDVMVNADGLPVLAGKKTPLAKLGEVVQKQLQMNPHLVVALSCDAETPYESFAAALVALKQAGAERIAILPPRGMA